MSIKICFIAPSEYGKNTAVNILKERYKIKNIKLAEPLYLLQDYFYKFINTEMKGEQDGKLLQYFGTKIREENPEFIVKHFSKRLSEIKEFDGIITNDDCRPPDYEFLNQMGFIFVKINGFKRNRIDHTKSDPKSSLEWQNSIPCDYSVDNFGGMKEFKENLFNLMYEVFKARLI